MKRMFGDRVEPNDKHKPRRKFHIQEKKYLAREITLFT
jgi:hypothetical protein